MSKDKMEEIFLHRVTVCQDNVHHTGKAYKQALAELERAKADLVLWQNSAKENV